jgi:hypothetical protein
VDNVAGLDGLAASFDGFGSAGLRAQINSSDSFGWDRFSRVKDGKWSVRNNGVINSSVVTTIDWTLNAQTFDGTGQKGDLDGHSVLDMTDADNPSVLYRFWP